MKIGTPLTHAFAAAARNRANNSAALGAPKFDQLLSNQADNGPARYDASPSAGTRSFSEMPIVAPASIDHPRETVVVTPNENSGDAVKTSAESTAEDARRPERAIETTGPEFVQIVADGEAVPPSNRAAVEAAASPVLTTAPAMRTSRRPSSIQDIPSIAARAGFRAQMQVTHLSVHIARASQGANIAINAGSLSEEDRQDLAAKATLLARSFGLKVEHLRIFGFNRSS